MATVRRLSPGIYEVDGQRILATTEAEALQKARANAPRTPTTAPRPAPAPSDPRILPNDTRINNVSTGIEASEDVADVEAGKGLQYGNVTKQTGALGDSREIIYDDQGRPIEMIDSLSGQQKAINQGDEALSIVGRNAALNQLGPGQFQDMYKPQTFDRKVGQDLFGADRQRIEDAVFGNLTRNLQRDKSRDWQAQEQALADRGIAIDPRDESYRRAMEQHNERYDAIEANARDRATQIGGQELTNAFGMQEQGIANQYAQGWGTRQNQLGEIQALSNMGPGLRTGNFQGFQGVGYQLPDPTEVALAQGAQRIDAKTANAALSKLGGSSGGQQGPAAPPASESPFNASQPAASSGPATSASQPAASAALASLGQPAPNLGAEFTLGTDRATLEAQQARAQSGTGQMNADRLAAINTALANLGTQQPASPATAPAVAPPAPPAPAAAPAPAPAPSGNLAALQAQRTQILNEIQRRGGMAAAPGFAAQLQQVEAQIRALRG